MMYVVLTDEELQKVNNKDNFNKKGYYCEVIMKHITEQIKDAKQVKYITGKDNITLGDIKYKRYKEKHYIECKKGRLFNNKYKACIDGKYTTKESRGQEKYYQQSGCERPWIYSTTYDRITFVFSDKVYLIGNASNFLETVLDVIQDRTNSFKSIEDFNNSWYNSIGEFYISEGVTGSINRIHKKYDTFLVNVDLDVFLDLHNISYQVIEYEVLNVDSLQHFEIMT